MSDTLLVEPSAQPAAARVLGTLLRSREIAIGAVLVLLVVLTTLKSSGFVFSSDGWRNLLVSPALLLILAVGQAVVIITRNVDLSVGSTLGLTAYLTGKVFIASPGMPVVAVFVIGLAFGGLLGLVNGLLVAYGRVPAMVITLGTLYIYRGVFLSWAGSDRVNADDFPQGFNDLGTASVLSVPVVMLIALAVMAVVGYYLRTARGGRELYATGSDPDAATLYGLPVIRRVLVAFVLSGALAGVAGVVYAARYGTVSSGAGSGLELQAVGAAVIGGVAIAGGVGTVWGAALGAVLLITINRALPMVGISDFWQRAVVGALIIAAIVLDRVLAARQERQLVAARDLARREPDRRKAGTPA
ncbi:rhamnose transport system permease protein [Nocardioides terrae]|uniref:Autoinducer 2 import system permease protein LsrC n=1 Tax=Nocardioides terrae TaxID=574651 RepID=A0A1I1IFS6_9ACTN|nr:ABC transporter permease [Nocardioides terrae]SFC35127.1 rhamnose transport system permease protein [Nocardioides terrae]